MKNRVIGNELRRTHFPYCLQKVGDGWVILSRDYKPIGIRTEDHVDYEPHAEDLKIDNATLQKLAYAPAGITINIDGDVTCVYLYNDGCIPTQSRSHMQSYLTRLAVLMKVGWK